MDTKLYVPVLTLSAKDNTKLIRHLKSGFKRMAHWNKNIFKIETRLGRNPYMDCLIDQSFKFSN